MNSRPWAWSVCKPVFSFTAHCVQWVGKKIKGCLVSLLKRSRRPKLSFFLFLGGSGGKSESLVLFARWVLLGTVAGIFDLPRGPPPPWRPRPRPRASERLLYQDYFHLPSPTPRLGGDRQLVFVAIQPEKNTSWKETMKQGNWGWG